MLYRVETFHIQGSIQYILIYINIYVYIYVYIHFFFKSKIQRQSSGVQTCAHEIFSRKHIEGWFHVSIVLSLISFLKQRAAASTTSWSIVGNDVMQAEGAEFDRVYEMLIEEQVLCNAKYIYVCMYIYISRSTPPLCCADTFFCCCCGGC